MAASGLGRVRPRGPACEAGGRLRLRAASAPAPAASGSSTAPARPRPHSGCIGDGGGSAGAGGRWRRGAGVQAGGRAGAGGAAGAAAVGAAQRAAQPGGTRPHPRCVSRARPRGPPAPGNPAGLRAARPGGAGAAPGEHHLLAIHSLLSVSGMFLSACCCCLGRNVSRTQWAVE